MTDQPQREAHHNTMSAGTKKPSKELTTRIISSVILVGFTLFMASYSWQSFLVLCALAAGLMIWEWGKLTNNDTPLQLAIQAGTVFLSILAFLTKEWPLFISIIIAGMLLASWSTHYWWRSKWALAGLFYVGLPILSLIYLRSDSGPDLGHGFEAILFVFLIVWGTDTAAYFSGRHFGGKKLVPAISPGKTWSGCFGGLFAGCLIGVLFAIAIDSNPLILGLIGLFLSAVSQVGDLTESAIKRHFGVKDSGHLIPGHGGMFDRLDGVIFALVAAAFIAMLHGHNTPAKALLYWPL